MTQLIHHQENSTAKVVSSLKERDAFDLAMAAAKKDAKSKPGIYVQGTQFLVGRVRSQPQMFFQKVYFSEIQLPAKHEGAYEMANLWPEDTGLPFTVWFSVKFHQHDMRVKIGDHADSLDSSVSFRDNVEVVAGKPMKPADLALLKAWIEHKNNRDTLIKFWNEEISTKTALNSFKHLEDNTD